MDTNAVGIDISKEKSTIAVMRPFGEIIRKPFDVHHSPSKLKELTASLKSLQGETRIVMEYTPQTALSSCTITGVKKMGTTGVPIKPLKSISFKIQCSYAP